jgi:hypothetical protein
MPFVEIIKLTYFNLIISTFHFNHVEIIKLKLVNLIISTWLKWNAVWLDNLFIRQLFL